MTITDGTLSRFVKRCQDLPGQHLFRWVDDTGEAHPVTSTDVNAYIRDAMARTSLPSISAPGARACSRSRRWHRRRPISASTRCSIR
jgi:hypothetical protein